MSERFDPVHIDKVTGVTLIDGAVRARVIDPDGHPNQVLDPDGPFDIEVDWYIEGLVNYQLALGCAAQGARWRITAYGESIGPGPEAEIGQRLVPVPGFTSQTRMRTDYSAKVTVPAGTLPENTPGGASGLYEISVVVFLNWRGPGGEDLIGFANARPILVENLD